MSTSTSIHNLILQPHSTPGRSGYQYDVFYQGNLLCTSIDPEHAACRELVKLGLKGEARFFRHGKQMHSSVIRNIEKGGQYCISESSKGGLRLRKYVPFCPVEPHRRVKELEGA